MPSTAAEYRSIANSHLSNYNDLNRKISIYQEYLNIFNSWKPSIENASENIVDGYNNIKNRGYKLSDGTSIQDAKFKDAIERLSRAKENLSTLIVDTASKISSMEKSSKSEYDLYLSYNEKANLALKASHGDTNSKTKLNSSTKKSTRINTHR